MWQYSDSTGIATKVCGSVLETLADPSYSFTGELSLKCKDFIMDLVFQRLIAGRYIMLGEKEHMDLFCGYVVNISVYF
jgi:hypothetical protein